MREIMKSAISGALSGGGRSLLRKEEGEALASLCMMPVHRTGDENPREMLRCLSDPLLEHLVKNVESMKSNPALGRVGQFFVIEWCFRNDHLTEDWKWEWETKDRGKLNYSPRIPLEMVPLPRPDGIVRHDGRNAG